MPDPGYELTADGDRAVIDVVGELDIVLADGLRAAGEAALADGCRVLVVDLAGVTFIDSTGVGAIVHINNLATERRKDFRLQGVTRPVQRILEITGLAGLFELADADADVNPSSATP